MEIKTVPSLFIIVFIHSFIQSRVWGQVGVAFSPFVKDNDRPSTSSYTRDDVKVMLRLVQEQRYHEISTYGVGAPNEPYEYDITWKRCASVVHSAVAAAEINVEQGTNALTVYQGLNVNLGISETQLRSEIEVGFEVALIANKLYSGTVKGMILPSIAGVDNLVNGEILNRIEEISSRSHSRELKFGPRIYDCQSFADKKTDIGFKRLLGLIDFIICQMLPSNKHLRKGPTTFLKDVLNDIEHVKKVVEEIEPNAPPTVMLETGWPGGDNLGELNTDISDLLMFWNSTQNSRGFVQIFMHEAFDNPWKKDLGAYYGRWYLTQPGNDISRNAYKLKVASVKIIEPKREEQSGLSKELIIGIVFGLVLFIALAILIIYVYRRVWRQLKKGSKLTEAEIRQFLDGIVTNEIVEEGRGDAWERVPYNRDFELERNKFSIDKTTLLGSGAFGSVYKGRIDGLVREAAFKMTRDDCPLTALKGLLSEIKILAYLGKHKNLVSICGAYTAELPNGIVYLATELCTNGSLEKYLRQQNPKYATANQERYVKSHGSNPNQISNSDMQRWAIEIASAMEYISSKNVIHADLATRNVLLTSNLTAKVTDFGLSRRLYEYTEYVKKQQEPLPWRWMAIESLKRLEFSSSSDTWSYAVLLWEIYSGGDIPYPGLSWNVDFVTQLENGLRMQQPARAETNIYEIMTHCWDLDPHQRPSFKMIKEALLSMRNVTDQQ